MISSFAVNGYRIIQTAQCADVPRLMMICGPNGVGKTTLLDALGRQHGVSLSGANPVVIVAPGTRTWRKENLQSRMLYANKINSSEVYSITTQLSTYGHRFGRNIYSGQRDLWSDDDAKQLVKPLLAKLKATWKDYVTKIIEEADWRTEAKEWPNPNSVLSAFSTTMFEELRYVDIIDTEENTQILFESVNRPGEPPLDIDFLSSGEKAIFSVFLPIIEEDFRRKMGEAAREITLIVDEIESHLHPSLQMRVLEYMRHKTTEGYQFICTTHSTTLIKACAQTELFHVLPKGTTVGNQLRRAASETNSLVEVVQESVIYASGYQRHIFCEGYDPNKLDENNICDSELYSELLALDTRQKVVAAGSKNALETGLKAASSSVFAPLGLVSIVDNDGTGGTDMAVPWCHVVLPVYSLESVLLSPEAVAEVLQRYGVTLEQADSAVTDAVSKAVAEREGQLITPGAVLKRKSNMTLTQALEMLEHQAITDVFELNPAGLREIKEEQEKIGSAKSNRDLAIKTSKGKKIYHYLFETLGLRGKAFTHRSFAMAVISNIRRRQATAWVSDLEAIVKYGVGNALSSILVSPKGDPLRNHPTHGQTMREIMDLVETKTYNGLQYATVKPNIRPETFAQRLATLSTGIRDVMPTYKWDSL